MLGESGEVLISPTGESVYFGGQGGPRRKTEQVLEDLIIEGQVIGPTYALSTCPCQQSLNIIFVSIVRL